MVFLCVCVRGVCVLYHPWVRWYGVMVWCMGLGGGLGFIPLGEIPYKLLCDRFLHPIYVKYF